MRVSDQFDLPLSVCDSAAAAGYDAYVQQFLSYGATLREFFPIADAHAGNAYLTAHAAALHLSFEAGEGWRSADPYLEKMRRARSGASEREGLFCDAVDAWAEKNFAGALAALDELTVRWPADLCAIKWGQYHAFNLGDQPALIRLGERARLVHEGQAYVHGMRAFALEQNHRLGEARDEALKASEIAIDDAWAHHAFAHVMETEHRPEEGARWLAHCAHVWDAKGVFIRIHNWWHATLFEIAKGDFESALEIFDARLWGEWPEFPQEQIGAVSALWRLELRGVDVGERWAPIAEKARENAGDHLLPFHDMHYLYALARAGGEGEAEAFIRSMTNTAEGGDNVWGEVALPLAIGLLAFGRNEHAQAVEAIAPLTPNIHRIGGSHAQRHLFVEVLESARAALSGEPASFSASA